MAELSSDSENDDDDDNDDDDEHRETDDYHNNHRREFQSSRTTSFRRNTRNSGRVTSRNRGTSHFRNTASYRNNVANTVDEDNDDNDDIVMRTIINDGCWAWSRHPTALGALLIWLGALMLTLPPTFDQLSPMSRSAMMQHLGAVLLSLLVYGAVLFNRIAFQESYLSRLSGYRFYQTTVSMLFPPKWFQNR
jgi:hypothetical protein